MASEPAAPERAGLPGGQLQTAVLALQRTAGNRAVQHLLRERRHAAPPPPDPKPSARRRVARATPAEATPAVAGPDWDLEVVPHVSTVQGINPGYELVRGGPPGEIPRLYRLMPDNSLVPTSKLDELCPVAFGPACWSLHMLRGGPKAMAEEATIELGVLGAFKLVGAGASWARSATNFDDIGDAGRLGMQEGAQEWMDELDAVRRAGSTPPSPELRFIGLAEDAEGAALVSVDEIAAAADEVGAIVVPAEALAEMGKNEGRLWLGRYGSGAMPGGRYPGKPGLKLLNNSAKAYGGKTGAIDLSKVPRPEWFSHIKPMIDEADQVMFHSSTGVGVVDKTGVQFLTNEELLYILNTPAAAQKTVFFIIKPL